MTKSFIFRFLLVFAAAFGLIFLFVFFYLSVTAPANAAEPQGSSKIEDVTFERGQVQVRSGRGRTFVFDVDIARTPEQQSLGLMHRTQLPAKTGMLFIYKPPRRIAMWMKNTQVPLDMLFAGRTGTVFYIKENAQPLSEDLIPAPGSVSYVLEVPAGTVEKLGLKAGDRLLR